MDTAKLELAAQRYRDAEAALAAAREDLQAEAVAVLQETERGGQTEVARLTGWPREQIRLLVRTATHADALARDVADQDGDWDTARAVAALRAAGVGVGSGDRADEKQAREALRKLEARGVLVRVDSPGNTAVYRRA
ncbi:hypothetical protein RVR_2804 [Actinacidiphila reveromycinica]|uniref:Uncharacterized protein n=1 Tax=Actinacidiphila reveromycinica TaxID=659352 RepID=A0A7U3UR30_9ACTN|nr:hypothetical protein [Streptomyces sp. SN-593]BBA97177.1 hypothetical protein RVR_2804 [Streptomyces sp. SN-593]